MKKTIKIGAKDYLMSASAYTSFKYKDETGHSLIKDLTKLAKDYKYIAELNTDEILDKYDDIEEIINKSLRIAYIMTTEANSFKGSFDAFLMEIDDYMTDITWISEVIELSTSPLSGNVQTS